MANGGTAPHKNAQGQWVYSMGPRQGQALTPAGQRYWHQQFRRGVTDGLGHMRQRPETSTVKPGVVYEKPSFDTVARAAGGDQTALAHIHRYELHLRAVKQAETQTNQLVSGQFGGVEQIAAGGYKTVNPSAGAVITSLSPYTAGQEAYKAASHGQVGPAALAAMGILPFGPGRAAKLAKAIKAGRAATEADVVAEMAAREAKAAAAPGSYITDALGAAKEARAKQTELYRTERARRIKESGQAFQAAGGGLEGHAASLAKLRGALPKIRFDDLSGISDQDMGKLMNLVQDNPALSEWDALSLRAGLIRARAGGVPRDFEIALMRKVFGLEKATEFANPSRMQKILRTAADVANIPRAYMSSADVSAVLRQSLVATVHRPGVAAKNIGPMFKMMFNQKFYDEAMAAIQRDPAFERAVTEDGLKMTDVHGPMGTREEAYPSQIAERIPGAGHIVKGSSRAYTGFINVMRWHVYNELLDLGRMDGALTPQLRRDAARVANWATGRGQLPGKTLEAAGPLLNTVFFSPRLMASRFQTFNPFFYANLDPIARKYAMKAAVKTFIAGMSVLGAAAAAGAKVNMDPTNADFGKIKVGDTRIDVWGGHQQWVRVAGQLAEGKITSSTTGKTIRLSGGYAGSSRWDVGSRFLQGKFSPPASLIRDWAHHTDFAGKPFSWKKAVVSRVYPLVIQDMLDTFHEYGLGPAVGVYGIGALGIGIQTYRPKKPKGSPSGDPFGGLSGTDPFAGLDSGFGGLDSGADPFAALP